ncbi:MAG: phage holin, LLH family [Oscillospiraceae bacterium]|nr:phage holin, LLH family [Oscillospiraceae bacterium]
MTEAIDLTAIINAVLALCAALITTRLIPWLGSKLESEQQEALGFWTDVAVRAAEQYFGSKAGQEKKAYVMSFLESRGFTADDALIEATVCSLFGLSATVTENSEGSSEGEF